MARKKEPKVPAVSVIKKPVRVDLLPADYKRLERQARKLDRSLSWYARMAIMERVKADEEGGK